MRVWSRTRERRRAAASGATPIRTSRRRQLAALDYITRTAPECDPDTTKRVFFPLSALFVYLLAEVFPAKPEYQVNAAIARVNLKKS